MSALVNPEPASENRQLRCENAAGISGFRRWRDACRARVLSIKFDTAISI